MEEPNEPEVVISQNQKDVALCHLVNMANAGASMGVTLLVEGQVVYGDLMSGKDYCQSIYENLSDANGHKEVANIMAGFFKELGEEYYSSKNLSEIPLNYLHLNNVAYLKGDGGQFNAPGALFRICIEKITGFSVGRPG